MTRHGAPEPVRSGPGHPAPGAGRAPHGHGHGHGHSHGPTGTAAAAQRGRLTVVLVITVAVLLAEVAGGLLAHSLVLLADAGHMAADAGGIGLSLLAISWAARPGTDTRTFGFQRAEILAAVANAVVLFVLGGFLAIEAVRRLLHPGTGHPSTMVVFGVLALAGNATSLLLLHRGSKHSLNLRGAYLEVASDLLGAAAIIVAAAVIALTGLQQADPIASLLIAALIIPRTLKLLAEALDVLLEATPRHVDLAEVRAHILATPGVAGVHDLHAWTITSGTAVLSAHVVVQDSRWQDGTAPQVLDELGTCLQGHFDLEHSTFQLEAVGHEQHESALHP